MSRHREAHRGTGPKVGTGLHAERSGPEHQGQGGETQCGEATMEGDQVGFAGSDKVLIPRLMGSLNKCDGEWVREDGGGCLGEG